MKPVGWPKPLREAVRELTDPNQWRALVQQAGTEDDAINALSGRPSGPLFLTAEIVRRSLSPDKREELRAANTLCRDIVDGFDARRRDGLHLRGYTAASPGKAVRIPNELPLTHDFATGMIQSGDLQFNGVTASLSANEMVKSDSGRAENTASDAQLRLRHVAEVP